MDSATLEKDRRLPFDRRFALAPSTTRIEGAHAPWTPKQKFIALFRHEKIATLETAFDAETETITVLRGGRRVARGQLTSVIGRSMLEDFFAAYLRDESRGRPRVVEAEPGEGLTDVPEPMISIISLASVQDLGERIIRQTIDPLRFRGNIHLAGARPWEEFQWLGRDIRIGGAVLEVAERTNRCAAVNVNPATGIRDLNLLNDLTRGRGHADMGIYARVKQSGTIRQGDPVELV